MASVPLEVKQKGEFIITTFERKVREFGLTSEEVDEYVVLLRIAQAQMLRPG